MAPYYKLSGVLSQFCYKLTSNPFSGMHAAIILLGKMIRWQLTFDRVVSDGVLKSWKPILKVFSFKSLNFLLWKHKVGPQ